MIKTTFTTSKFVIEYILIGKGSTHIICFHGFGRRAEDFEIFESLLLPDQQIISVNLFAHGESVFPSDRIECIPLQKEEWKQLFSDFLNFLGVGNFHLVGYSMGGRVALVLLELMPDRVRSLLLLAPDGFKINLIYKFASETKLGRSMYKYLIDHPGWLFQLAKALNRIGILNDKLHRFVHVHLDTQTKRQQVYDVWLIYKNIFPDLDALAAYIRKHPDFAFAMVFGQFDSIIKPKLGLKFCAKIGDDRSMHTIHSGHRLLTENTILYLRKNQLWPH